MERVTLDQHKEREKIKTRLDRRQTEADHRRRHLISARRHKVKASSIQVDKRNQRIDVRHDSVTFIQNNWHEKHLKRVVEEFCDTGVVQMSQKGDFENMKAAMMEQRSIRAAHGLVWIMTRCDPVVAALTKRQHCDRILLTSLLLRYYAEEVMPQPNEEELAVLEAARKLSDALMNCLKFPCRRLLLSCANAWSEFLALFSAWQKESRAALVQEMQKDYQKLVQLEAMLGPEAKREWVPHIRRHQKRLFAALQRVGGVLAVSTLKVSDDKASVGEVEVGEEEEEEGALSCPEKDIVDIASAFGNIHIAHEMIIDPSFNFQKLMALKTGRECGSNVVIEITSGDMRTFVLFVLAVKQQLLEMLKEHNGPFMELQEHLDEQLLYEQLENNAIDSVAILDFLFQCMSKMCAPIRDPDLKCLEAMLEDHTISLTTVCESLGRLLVAMNEDLAQFHMARLRPQLEQCIVTYERDWFARNLKSYQHAQELTRIIYIRMRDGWQNKKPLAIDQAVLAEELLLLMNVPHDSLADLKGKFEISSHELLVLDHSRLVRIASQINNIVRLSALVIVVRTIEQKIETLDLGTFYQQMEIDSSSLIAEIQKTLQVNNTKSLGSACHQIFSGNDPVVALLRRRVSSMLRSSMLGTSEARAAVILGKNGIAPSLRLPFARLDTELRNMFQLHCHVLLPLYHKFIQDAKPSTLQLF